MLEKFTTGIDSPFKRPVTTEEASWVTAATSLGAIFGPFVFGMLPDRIGRKYTLLANGFVVVIGYIMILSSRSLYNFYIARFALGMCSGSIFNLIPVYTGEIASSQNRGALTSLLNLLFCTGMLYSYCVGPYISFMIFNITLLVFPMIFFVTFFIVGTETPYYFLRRGKKDLARQTLQKLRNQVVDIDEELVIVEKSLTEIGNGTLATIFASKELKKALLIMVGLILFEQFSGISAVQYYAQSIFGQAGVTIEPAICSIIIGIVQLGVSLTIPFTIDRLGRKKTLLISSIGMFLSEAPLGVYSYLKDNKYDVSQVSILPLICLIAFTTFYTFGYGPIPWIILGEIFPSNVKSAATLTVTCSCRIVAFFITKYYPTVSASIGMGTAFLIFSASSALSIPFAYFVVIETKGRSLHDITRKLGSN